MRKRAGANGVPMFRLDSGSRLSLAVRRYHAGEVKPLELWRPWAVSRQSRNPGGLARGLERDDGERLPIDSDVGPDHWA